MKGCRLWFAASRPAVESVRVSSPAGLEAVEPILDLQAPVFQESSAPFDAARYLAEASELPPLRRENQSRPALNQLPECSAHYLLVQRQWPITKSLLQLEYVCSGHPPSPSVSKT